MLSAAAQNGIVQKQRLKQSAVGDLRKQRSEHGRRRPAITAELRTDKSAIR